MKRTSILLSVLLLMTVQIFANGQEEEHILYVNASSTSSSSNGTSWAKAYPDLQQALAIAEAGDQIWVAAGTYYPSKADASVPFVMKDDVDVYGGFAGNETKLEARDYVANVTILSGEIGNKKSTKDNSSNVVVAANSIIDGFTIRDGVGMSFKPSETSTIPTMNAQTAAKSGLIPKGSGNKMQGPPPQGAGGNMQGPPPQSSDTADAGVSASTSGLSLPSDLGHSSPDQIMGQGISYGNGAGLLIWQTSPTVRNCIFTSNSTGKGGAIYVVGPGMVGPNQVSTVEGSASPVFVNCTISDNVAFARGGGVCFDLRAGGTFIDCVFSNNVCESGKGGAVYNDFGCSPSFENCLFVSNNAESGGAMASDGGSNPLVSDCTFFGNSADVSSAALYQGTGPFNDPTVVNSIIWGNSCDEDVAGVYSWNDSNPSISYSLIEGGYEGEAIVDGDPLFIDAKNGDFSLALNSIALTAGKEGKRIGFDASYIGNRSEEAIASLVKELSIIPEQEKIAVLDLAISSSPTIVATNGVVFVTSEGTGNGSSWNTATGSLQDALDYAGIQFAKDGSFTEIWVEKGTYVAGAERSDSFILHEGAFLYGGFGGDETKREDRDYAKNSTVLSGEIGDSSTASDNVYHVLIGSDNALLDGFIITGGYADKSDSGQVYDDKGGAILNYAAGYRVRPDVEPTLGFDLAMKNCLFVGNYAIEGGAVYTYHGGNPTFENCEFYENTAFYGGAVLDRAGVNSIYTDCTFTANYSLYKGGASFVDYGSMATFESCLFQNNQAGSNGGAIYVIDRASQKIPNETDYAKIDPSWSLMTDIFSSVLVQDCQFANNKAKLDGGVAFVYEGSKFKVENTVFIGNTAGRDAASIMLSNKSVLYLSNGQVIDGVVLDATSSKVEQ
jgi:predicted outer membrane repeat protein